MIGELVRVTWLDHVHHTSWGEHEDVSLATCVSVGWVLAETDEAMVLTSHVAYGEPCHTDAMVIGKALITQATTIEGNYIPEIGDEDE